MPFCSCCYVANTCLSLCLHVHTTNIEITSFLCRFWRCRFVVMSLVWTRLKPWRNGQHISQWNWQDFGWRNGLSFCDLRALEWKLASPFGHPTQVSTKFQLGGYLRLLASPFGQLRFKRKSLSVPISQLETVTPFYWSSKWNAVRSKDNYLCTLIVAIGRHWLFSWLKYISCSVFTCLVNTCAEFKLETLKGVRRFQRLQFLRSRIKKLYKYGVGQKRY